MDSVTIEVNVKVLCISKGSLTLLFAALTTNQLLMVVPVGNDLENSMC